MQLVVIDNGDMRFLTGEVELKACKERYNADAITTAFDHEISILETSGHYQLNNEPSFGYDHIKGAFAALSMLQKKQTEERIHLWLIKIVSQDLHLLQRIAVTDVPTSVSEPSKLLNLGNFFYKYKICLNNTSITIKQMKDEHEEYLCLLELDDGEEVEGRENLASWIKFSIQKPERGNGYGILLPEEYEGFEVKKKVVVGEEKEDH